MKQKQKKYIFLILLIILSLLVGCTNPTSNQANKEVEEIKIIDCIGREVKIPKKAKKVACFYPLAAHAVTMLDKDVEIVAVASGLKRDVLLEKLNPSMKNAVIAGAGRVVNIETLMNQDPDLVIINENMAKIEGEIQKLEKSHIPYIVVQYKNIEEQQYVISMLGKAIGAETKAEKYNQYYKEHVELVKERVQDVPVSSRAHVFYSMSEAPRTETRDNIVTDWLKVAGLINVVEDNKLKLFEKVKHYASIEQIYAWDPDAFIVSETETTEYIMRDKQWSALKAVKNNRVYQLPLGISRWGHPSSLEIPLTLLWAGKTFYPDYFKDIDLNLEIKKFYSDFFEYDLDDKELEKILSGKGMRL